MSVKFQKGKLCCDGRPPAGAHLALGRLRLTATAVVMKGSGAASVGSVTAATS